MRLASRLINEVYRLEVVWRRNSPVYNKLAHVLDLALRQSSQVFAELRRPSDEAVWREKALGPSTLDRMVHFLAVIYVQVRVAAQNSIIQLVIGLRI